MCSTTISSPAAAPSGHRARQISPCTRTRPSGRQSVTATPSAPASASAPIAGFRRFENQTQNQASVVSTMSAATTAAIPHPVGSQKMAATMANASSSG